MKTLIASIFLCISLSLSAQADSIPRAPYLRFPSFPPVTLILSDSSVFTKEDLAKKSPVMLMIFSPDCDHCQHETEDILANISRFKDVQIVMSTNMPFASMVAFKEKYGLARHKNIIVGYDKNYLLPVFYNIRHLPFLGFYNNKKQLISVFEGMLSVDKMVDELSK